ncbi:hypothetical protein HK098_006481, partial [Nowakowskiella sp. JEL0407]
MTRELENQENGFYHFTLRSATRMAANSIQTLHESTVEHLSQRIVEIFDRLFDSGVSFDIYGGLGKQIGLKQPMVFYSLTSAGGRKPSDFQTSVPVKGKEKELSDVKEVEPENNDDEDAVMVKGIVR